MADPEPAGKSGPALKGLAAVFGRPAPTRRQLLLGGGHLAALWALAFVQPLLDLLGKNPDFFVARSNTPGDILIVAIGFTLLPPLALLAVEWLVSKLSSKAYYGLHFAFLALIATFFFIQLIGDRIGARSAVIFLIALALASLLAFGIFRITFLRNLMDILIVAPLVILLLFIFASRSTDVIFPKGSKFSLAKDSGDDRPIVLVIFDELGTDNLMTDNRQIDGARFPNFANLAKSSTWYKNQTTTAFLTPMAVPGILTGRDESADTLPTWQARPESIFSQFSRGRQVHVLEPVTAICPPMICGSDQQDESQATRLKALWSDLKYVEGRLILPPGMAATLPDVSTNFQGFGGDGGDSPVGGTAPKPGKHLIRKKGKLFVKAFASGDPAEYEAFIRQMPTSDRSLTVMHMSLPHTQWKFDARGRRYNKSPIDTLSDGIDQWLVDGNGIATSQARMLTQTAYADDVLGQIRHRLEKSGLWDKAIVVVSADHGISFEGDGVEQRRLNPRAMGDVANPPLFIKYPGQKKGQVSLTHSMTLDIVPTIARAVRVKNPYRTDGLPLQGEIPSRQIKVTDTKGGTLTADEATMIRQRAESIARANERLGTGPIYTLGPAPELLGRPAPAVPSGSSGAQLDDPSLWQNYKPGRDRIPMFITGRTAAPAPSDPADAPVIAVAVDGVIRGTGKVFEFKGATRFGALVDPKSLRPGANRIGIYQVEGDRLTPLGGN